MSRTNFLVSECGNSGIHVTSCQQADVKINNIYHITSIIRFFVLVDIDDFRCNVLFNSISVYHGDEQVIMKSCVQWNPVYDWKDLRLRRGS